MLFFICRIWVESALISNSVVCNIFHEYIIIDRFYTCNSIHSMNIEKLRVLFESSTDKYEDARKMGTTYQNMMKILKGDVNMKVSTLEGIAKFYGVPVGYFFDEAEADGKSVYHVRPQMHVVREHQLENENLKGQIKGMQDALDRLGFSLQGHIIEDI